MSTPKHTPGPWAVHTFTISGKERLEVLDATGTNACVQANAHLIAAAPAMYEALVNIANAGQRGPLRCADFYAITQHARAALVQAEGKQ